MNFEVDCGGKDDDNALRLKDIANVSAENIYIKSDGSIDDGFEIVSHPMTLDYHMNTIDWESLMHEAIRMGYRSHKTSTCGLHVHINRNAFGANQEEQEAVIEKVLYFVEKNWNELFRFSRRTEYNMNRWSARHGYEKTGKEIMKKAKGDCNRYVAVNLRNYNTIEFRMFRGTLKYNTFIAILQMVNRIVYAELIGAEHSSELMPTVVNIPLLFCSTGTASNALYTFSAPADTSAEATAFITEFIMICRPLRTKMR